MTTKDRPEVWALAPLRMFFSAAPWAATAYLMSYLVVGPVLFAVALTVVLVSLILSIVWIGLPLLVGAACIVRGAAGIERWRSRLVLEPIAESYRSVHGSGVFAQLRTRWSDRATWRDLGYLVLMFVPLFTLDLVALILWLVVLGMSVLPFWYWSIPSSWDNVHGVMIGYLPNGPYTTFTDGFGVWVGDLGTAVMVGVGFFVVALLASHFVFGVARLHARVVRSLLGPVIDPLAPAKQVLAEPGPLTA